jgi:tryptophanyl-tRNA synthetase
MSTTGGSEQGTLYVLDDADTVRRKLRRAVADSGREIVRREDKPGISNLIEIMAVARGVGPERIEREFDGSGYGDFKTAVADAVVDWLAPVRKRYEALRGDPDELERLLAAGADKARAIAGVTAADVREAMGVGPPRSVGSGA